MGETALIGDNFAMPTPLTAATGANPQLALSRLVFLRWLLLCRPALRKHHVAAVVVHLRRVQTLLLTHLQPNLLHLLKKAKQVHAVDAAVAATTM